MADPSSEASHPDGMERLLAVEYLDLDGEPARARLGVRDDVRQPYGVVHGGAYSVLAESVCSRSTDRAVHDDGMVAIGQSLQVTFLRPIAEGHLNAAAYARHRGRTSWVWDVEITDDEARLCALARMTVAVRPAR